MRVFATAFLLFIGICSFSQKLDSVQQAKILERIGALDFEVNYKTVIDSCDKYLEHDFSVCKYRAGLYSFKAEGLRYSLYSIFDYDLIEYNTDSIDSVIFNIEKDIIRCYDSAISECIDCELNYTKLKYEFLAGAQYFNINDDELKKLKQNGFKIEEEFLSLSPQYFYGNNQWIGAEFSVNVLQRKYKLMKVDSSIMWAASGLNIGFRKNISNERGWGMNFSLASWSWNWINFRPANLSYLNNGENKSWGYSPEVGFQFWYLHLNAGYNFAFKKSMRDYERLYFSAKFDIPFYRF